MKKPSPITLINHIWSSYNLIHLNKQLQSMFTLVRDVTLPTCFYSCKQILFYYTNTKMNKLNCILPCTSKQLLAYLFLVNSFMSFCRKQKNPTLYFWRKVCFKDFCNWIIS